MISRFHPWLLRLAAICLILMMQGPAVVVQEIAWMKMLVTYTQQRGLKRGVIETFDGKHPCKLCCKAAEIRKNETPQNPADKPIASMKRLAWAEMVSPKILVMPGTPSRETDIRIPSWLADHPGRKRDAPDSPPPEA
jgi:hypothetical protein